MSSSSFPLPAIPLWSLTSSLVLYYHLYCHYILLFSMLFQQQFCASQMCLWLSMLSLIDSWYRLAKSCVRFGERQKKKNLLISSNDDVHQCNWRVKIFWNWFLKYVVSLTRRRGVISYYITLSCFVYVLSLFWLFLFYCFLFYF